MYLIWNVNSFVFGKEKLFNVHFFLSSGRQKTYWHSRLNMMSICTHQLSHRCVSVLCIYLLYLQVSFVFLDLPDSLTRKIRFINHLYRGEQNNLLSSCSILNAGDINLQESWYKGHKDGEVAHLQRGGKIFQFLSIAVFSSTLFCVSVPVSSLKRKRGKNARNFMKTLLPC